MTAKLLHINSYVRRAPVKPRLIDNETHRRLIEEILLRDLEHELERALDDPAFAATLGLT